MLKVKAGELFLSQAALAELVTKDLPNKTAMQLRRIIKHVDPEIKSFDEQRMEVAKKLGKLSEDGQSYTVDDSNIAEFNKEMETLGGTEFTFEDLEQISDLGKAEIKTSMLFTLGWLIAE